MAIEFVPIKYGLIDLFDANKFLIRCIWFLYEYKVCGLHGNKFIDRYLMPLDQFGTMVKLK